MRTTLDIDDPILRDLKRLQKREKKSLGRLVSDLLAAALSQHSREAPVEPLRWISKPMTARVDLADSAALWTVMEESESDPKPPGRRR